MTGTTLEIFDIENHLYNYFHNENPSRHNHEHL